MGILFIFSWSQLHESLSPPVNLSAYPGTSGLDPKKFILPISTPPKPRQFIKLIIAKFCTLWRNATVTSNRDSRTIMLNCHSSELMTIKQLTSFTYAFLHKECRPTAHLHLHQYRHRQQHRPQKQQPNSCHYSIKYKFYNHLQYNRLNSLLLLTLWLSSARPLVALLAKKVKPQTSSSSSQVHTHPAPYPPPIASSLSSHRHLSHTASAAISTVSSGMQHGR